MAKNMKYSFLYLILIFLFSINVINNLLFGISMLHYYHQPDIRIIAAAYIDQEIPAGTSIGTYLYPNFYGPYIPIDTNKYQTSSYRAYVEKAELITNPDPDYLILEYQGFTDLGLNNFFNINNDYQLIKTFEKPLKNIGPFKFSQGFQPEDATIIRLYQRKLVYESPT